MNILLFFVNMHVLWAGIVRLSNVVHTADIVRLSNYLTDYHSSRITIIYLIGNICFAFAKLLAYSFWFYIKYWFFYFNLFFFQFSQEKAYNSTAIICNNQHTQEMIFTSIPYNFYFIFIRQFKRSTSLGHVMSNELTWSFHLSLFHLANIP